MDNIMKVIEFLLLDSNSPILVNSSFFWVVIASIALPYLTSVVSQCMESRKWDIPRKTAVNSIISSALCAFGNSSAVVAGLKNSSKSKEQIEFIRSPMQGKISEYSSDLDNIEAIYTSEGFVLSPEMLTVITSLRMEMKHNLIQLNSIRWCITPVDQIGSTTITKFSGINFDSFRTRIDELSKLVGDPDIFKSKSNREYASCQSQIDSLKEVCSALNLPPHHINHIFPDKKDKQEIEVLMQ